MLNYIKSQRIVFLLVLMSSVFYASFAYDLIRSDFIKLITLYCALFFVAYKIIQISKDNFILLTGIGILFRLFFIGGIPNLSQDFYRFLWDGRILIQGLNPYLYTPEVLVNNSTFFSSSILEGLLELYHGMGSLSASHYSNYPPINQLFFAIAAILGGKSIIVSVIILKLVIIAADIGILFLGKKILTKLNLPIHNIFWYFLNPFVLIELTGNLHFEGVMLFFLIYSIYLLQQQKLFWPAVLLAISISVKLIPLMFLPIFFQWFMVDKPFGKGIKKLLVFYLIVITTILITFLPFLSNDFASNYFSTISLWFQNFEFNASVYYVIRWIGFKIVGWNLIETVGKILPILVLSFILIITFFRKNKNINQLISSMLLVISFYFLLSTTVHPWYIATPLLLSIFTTYKFPILWSLVVVVSYSAYGSQEFIENVWLISFEYLAVIPFAIWEIFFKLNLKRLTN